MFERYTEKARRTIFFARYDASASPTSFIEPEHLLLGALREFRDLAVRLPMAEIHKRIADKLPPAEEKRPTSADMPLSSEAKRALAFGAEEAERLHHKFIDCGHLVLGLIRESRFIAELLQEFTLNPEIIQKMLPAPSEQLPPPHSVVFDPQNRVPDDRVLVKRLLQLRLPFSPEPSESPIGPNGWSRKDALGHLIDSSATHLQWIARALTEPDPVFSGPVSEDWPAAIGYKTFPWRELVSTWTLQNRLLARIIARIPEEKLSVICRIGNDPQLSLEGLIATYITHSEEVIAQIAAGEQA